MIIIKDLKKNFDDHAVLRGVNLTIPAAHMTCILGRSGEGKSVLLKTIMGLIRPTSGSITIDGVDIFASQGDPSAALPACGYVFQFAALLDSLTIFENVGISLLEKGISPQAVLSLVKEKLALVHLSPDILYKYPSDLSGGMRKRVGIARALLNNPAIILYDEPTTGLDPITTHVVHELMADTQRKLHVTSVVISHDVEVLKYVDYVALLQDGQIKFFGKADTIWESENPYIYQFIRGLTQGPIQAEREK